MEHQESLFEQFMDEATGTAPLQVRTDEDVVEWTVPVPPADGVCDLDDVGHPLDVLDALLGEDLADDVVDVLEPLPWGRTLDAVTQLRRHFALPVLPPGTWTHLVEQIDLYGEAVEADLADRGWDLLDWFRGRHPWPQLLRLLPRLPEGSRYKAAVLDDEDLARERLTHDTDDTGGRRRRPPLIGETQDRTLLRGVLSTLLRVEHAIYASRAPKGKAGRPPRPLLGPETAEDRIRDAVADAEVEDIFDQVTPGWRAHGSGLLVPTDT